MITPPPEMNLIGLRLNLARLRGERGWTYDQLAERSGLGRRTLIEIEQGRAIGSLTSWHALAHAFEIPLEALLVAACEGHTLPGAATS